MKLINPIRLKQALAVSAILEDKKTIEQIIDEQPTIEPERKKGKWIETDKHDIYYQPGYKCSVCGVLTTCHGDYCPNCGADMRERRTDE